MTSKYTEIPTICFVLFAFQSYVVEKSPQLITMVLVTKEDVDHFTHRTGILTMPVI